MAVILRTAVTQRASQCLLYSWRFGDEQLVGVLLIYCNLLQSFLRVRLLSDGLAAFRLLSGRVVLTICRLEHGPGDAQAKSAIPR